MPHVCRARAGLVAGAGANQKAERSVLFPRHRRRWLSLLPVLACGPGIVGRTLRAASRRNLSLLYRSLFVPCAAIPSAMQLLLLNPSMGARTEHPPSTVKTVITTAVRLFFASAVRLRNASPIKSRCTGNRNHTRAVVPTALRASWMACLPQYRRPNEKSSSPSYNARARRLYRTASQHAIEVLYSSGDSPALI